MPLSALAVQYCWHGLLLQQAGTTAVDAFVDYTEVMVRFAHAANDHCCSDGGLSRKFIICFSGPILLQMIEF